MYLSPSGSSCIPSGLQPSWPSLATGLDPPIQESDVGSAQTYFPLNKVNQLLNQPLFHPITSSSMAKGEWWSDRCRYTGSHSHKSTHRRFRLYGRFLLTRAEIMFGRRLSVWAALSRTALLTTTPWVTGWKRCPKHCLLYFTLACLPQLAGTSLNKKQQKK